MYTMPTKKARSSPSGFFIFFGYARYKKKMNKNLAFFSGIVCRRCFLFFYFFFLLFSYVCSADLSKRGVVIGKSVPRGTYHLDY